MRIFRYTWALRIIIAQIEIIGVCKETLLEAPFIFLSIKQFILFHSGGIVIPSSRMTDHKAYTFDLINNKFK